ncbi:MAG: hypothetical protein JWR68_941 [Polaromonas sp.]|nr:hypothetical protein [Polaromonas sp.]
MTDSTQTSTSGEGSRPTTSGGVDNLGGADSFTPGQPSKAGDTSPGPQEKMTEKRQDGSAASADHPAPHSTD